MLGKVVLVCTDRANTWRQVSSPLSSTGNRVVRASTTALALELVWSGAVDLILCEWPSGMDVDQVLNAARGRVPVMALTRDDGRAALFELACQRGVMHVCIARSVDGGEAGFDANELVVSCEKILRRDCFGIAKYFGGFGIELMHHVVTRADDRDAAVDRLSHLVRSMGGGRRVVDSVALVADELITNAVYNAPRDNLGNPRYAHFSRRDKITLAPTEYVRLEYGSDGNSFGLAVVDNFGALHPDTLRRGVHRCLTQHDQIEQKAGGAGIGLYTALAQCTQLIINIEPGVRTEIIGLWDLTRRGRGLANGTGSLHIFGSDETATRRRRLSTADDELDAVPEPSVALSDSVRCDIVEQLADTGVSLPKLERVMLDDEEQRLERRAPSGSVDVWRERADLTHLRGVHVLRRSDRPGLDTTLARIRGSFNLADAVSAAMTYLVNDWTAAALLCRIGDSLVPWCGAGDVSWDDALHQVEIPLQPELADGSLSPNGGHAAGQRRNGWFGARTATPGVVVAPIARDPSSRQLSDLLIGAGSNEALILSLGDESDVLLVLFAARPRTGHASARQLAGYERLQGELEAVLRRIADAAVQRDTIEIDVDDLWMEPLPVTIA